MIYLEDALNHNLSLITFKTGKHKNLGQYCISKGLMHCKTKPHIDKGTTSDIFYLIVQLGNIQIICLIESFSLKLSLTISTACPKNSTCVSPEVTEIQRQR